MRFGSAKSSNYLQVDIASAPHIPSSSCNQRAIMSHSRCLFRTEKHSTVCVFLQFGRKKKNCQTVNIPTKFQWWFQNFFKYFRPCEQYSTRFYVDFIVQLNKNIQSGNLLKPWTHIDLLGLGLIPTDDVSHSTYNIYESLIKSFQIVRHLQILLIIIHHLLHSLSRWYICTFSSVRQFATRVSA